MKEENYIREKHLEWQGPKAISIECLRPKINPKINEIRANLSNLLNIDEKSIGITATTGEGLTEFGKGNGIFVKVIASFSKEK